MKRRSKRLEFNSGQWQWNLAAARRFVRLVNRWRPFNMNCFVVRELGDLKLEALLLSAEAQRAGILLSYSHFLPKFRIKAVVK